MKNRNQKIADNFSAHYQYYDEHAKVQKQVAKNLIGLLPDRPAKKILEIGCGTGFLTKHLFLKYPDAEFHITDLSKEMVEYCHQNHPNHNAKYFVMDGEDFQNDVSEDYDFIVSSMTFQWFETPIKSLQNLSKNFDVYYTALGTENFKEWKNIISQKNIIDKTLPAPLWPNIIKEEFIHEDYADGVAFLNEIKKSGTATPTNQEKNNITDFKRALAEFDGNITWHIIYGFQPSDNTIIGT